jgi:hypothetical protein
MIYQFTCDKKMFAWVTTQAYQRRWPRSYVVVEAVKNNLVRLTQAEIAAQNERNSDREMLISNAECAPNLAGAVKHAQEAWGVSQAVIIRACIAREMTPPF